MKIHVGVVVKIDKKNKKLCGRNCPGIYYDRIDGYLCTIFEWKKLRHVEGEKSLETARCRACVRNQIPMRGVK